MTEPRLPTCACGRDRNHPLVQVEPKFGFWAWVSLLSGISATPKRVTFRCPRCHRVIEVSEDPEVLQAH